jgi:hypothetical protein
MDGPTDHGLVVNHWDHLHYIPDTGFEGEDSFSYCLSHR